MKKILAIILTIVLLISCGANAFAATMSSWFVTQTASTMQIVDAEENLMVADTRINQVMIIYGIYDLFGEVDMVDISDVEAPFTDMNSFEPYSLERKAVTWLYLKGILKGYPDSTCKPKDSVTRAELATILARTVEKNNGTTIRVTNNPYGDMNGHWAYDSVMKVTAIGLMQGDGANFNPDNWVTKEEVITIGLRLADVLEVDINEYADIIDDIYKVTIDYPISGGTGDYSQYDYIINVGDYENVYFDGLNSISSYTTSKTGIVTISKYSSYLKVTGKAEGVVTITGISSSGYKKSVTVLVQDRYSNQSISSYTVRVGNIVRLYHPSGYSIKSYSISGSLYVTITKQNGYYYAKGLKVGTAKIKLTDTYGTVKTVTVKVTNSNTSGSYEQEYTAQKGETIRIYPSSGRNISSYYVSLGSQYISVTKNSSYLSVYCSKAGTAKIRITDSYGDEEISTIYIDNSSYNGGDYGYEYGVTDTYYLERGDSKRIYFDFIDEIDNYDISKFNIVSVTPYDDSIKVQAIGIGSVTLTGYDYNGNSEKVKIVVEGNYYDGEEDDYDDTSRPPYRPIIYPPDKYEDIS